VNKAWPTWPPASGRDDPATSYDAEAAVTGSGKRRTHAEMVLAWVTRHPGLVAPYYGTVTGLGHVEAQRRLSDLKARGLVRQGARQGRYMTWWPVIEPVQGELAL
jgi:hypothetical protein